MPRMPIISSLPQEVFDAVVHFERYRALVKDLQYHARNNRRLLGECLARHDPGNPWSVHETHVARQSLDDTLRNLRLAGRLARNQFRLISLAMP